MKLIDEDIYKELPYPIAAVVDSINEETDNGRLFYGLLRIFSSTVKYLALLLVSDYINRDDIEDERLDEYLSLYLAYPSLGHWFYLCQAIPGVYLNKKESLFVRELEEFAPGGKLLRKITPNAEKILAIRNHYAHAHLIPDKDEAGDLITTIYEKIGLILKEISFLKNYKLLSASENGEFLLCMGEKIQKYNNKLTFEVESGKTLILNKEVDNFALLHPFLILGSGGNTDEKLELLLYEAMRRGKKVTYLGPGGYFESKHYIMLLDKVISGFSSKKIAEELEEKSELKGQAITADVLWRLLTSSNNPRSRNALGRFIGRFKYFSGCYTSRTSMNIAFDNYLKDEKSNLFIIEGESGTGKSTFIANNLFNNPNIFNNDNNVLAYLPADITKRGDISVSLSLSFLPDFDEPEKIWKFIGRNSQDKRFILVIDGLNEAPRPSDIFEEVLRYINSDTPPWLKIIITTRPRTIENCLNQGGVLPAYTNIYKLKGFDKAELNEAFEKYKKAYQIKSEINDELLHKCFLFFSDPLILKLVCERYTNQEIPGNIDIKDIYHTYFERLMGSYSARLKKGCEKFLIMMSEKMILSATDRLKCDSLSCGTLLYEMLNEPPLPVDSLEPYCMNLSCEASHVISGVSDGACPSCHQRLEQGPSDIRSPYKRLLDDYILAEFEDSEEGLYVGFVEDRLFEYLACKILEKTPWEKIEEISIKSSGRASCESVLVSSVMERKELAEYIISWSKSGEPSLNRLAGEALYRLNSKDNKVAQQITFKMLNSKSERLRVTSLNNLVRLNYIEPLGKMILDKNENVSFAAILQAQALWDYSPAEVINLLNYLIKKSKKYFLITDISALQSSFLLTYMLLGRNLGDKELSDKLLAFWKEALNNILTHSKRRFFSFIPQKAVIYTISFLLKNWNISGDIEDIESYFRQDMNKRLVLAELGLLLKSDSPTFEQNLDIIKKGAQTFDYLTVKALSAVTVYNLNRDFENTFQEIIKISTQMENDEQKTLLCALLTGMLAYYTDPISKVRADKDVLNTINPWLLWLAPYAEEEIPISGKYGGWELLWFAPFLEANLGYEKSDFLEKMMSWADAANDVNLKRKRHKKIMESAVRAVLKTNETNNINKCSSLNFALNSLFPYLSSDDLVLKDALIDKFAVLYSIFNLEFEEKILEYSRGYHLLETVKTRGIACDSAHLIHLASMGALTAAICHESKLRALIAEILIEISKKDNLAGALEFIARKIISEVFDYL